MLLGLRMLGDLTYYIYCPRLTPTVLKNSPNCLKDNLALACFLVKIRKKTFTQDKLPENCLLFFFGSIICLKNILLKVIQIYLPILRVTAS